jgi:tryptophan synthase alpha chain
VLDGIARAEAPVPIAVMTYYNLVFRAGHRRMARSMAEAGVSGAIVADLPVEEIGPWAAEADAAGVATVLLVAPSSPPERFHRRAPRRDRLNESQPVPRNWCSTDCASTR